MSEWEYYYLDENSDEDGIYESGLFQIKRKDIGEENTFDGTFSFGKINLDFKDGEIAGIEIYEQAEKIIAPAWREGNVDNPATFKLNEEEDSKSMIDILKEKGFLQ